MRKLILLLGLVTLANGLFASPIMLENEEMQMGRESHGGDRVGLEFIASARAGIEALISMGVKIPTSDLKNILDKSLIASTDEDLLIDRNNNKQISTAINYFDTESRPIIRINSAKWNSLSLNNKRALAVHELLCLLKLEKTYDYKYSSYLSNEILDSQLSANGFVCKNDLLKLSKEQLDQLLGNYQYENYPITLKIFVDYRSKNVKYIHEIKNPMIGTFTTAQALTVCSKKGLPNLYLPIAGGLVTYAVNDKQLQVELNGIDNDGPLQNYNKLQD